MRQLVRWSLVVWSSLAVACASSSRPTAGAERTRSRSDVITPEEIERAQWANAYDLVNDLRPHWLRPRGATTLSNQPQEVQVVMDGVKLGGVSALRGLAVNGFDFLQYYDPITAASRWGLGFGQGAIYITTRTR
jgi:hypothetical protein